MSITASQLERAGHYSLDANLRNKPIDQIGQDRPLLAFLMKGAKEFPGGKQYVRENIRMSYDSNFQWFAGDDEVTYNKRDPVRQAEYPWKEAHDGFTLNERELFENGIVVVDDNSNKATRNSDGEADRLADLLDENVVSLREGFEDKFDYTLHQDGTQDTDAVAGIDHLISLSPSTGTVGGIDRSTAEYWRNYAKTGISSTTIIDEMEKAWRANTRHRGQPDFILAGEDFIDAFRTAAKDEITRYLGLNGMRKGSAAAKLDPSSDLFFHGIQIVRDPTALDLDSALSPTNPFQKRCYFLSSKALRLRPAKGHNMITRNPPRVYNRYAHYWGLTWKGALTCGQPNSCSALAIS